MTWLFWKMAPKNDCNMAAIIDWLRATHHDKAADDLQRLKDEYDALLKRKK